MAIIQVLTIFDEIDGGQTNIVLSGATNAVMALEITSIDSVALRKSPTEGVLREADT